MEQFMAKAQPIPRAGHPEDIAGMALYLASDDSEFVTGQAMVVDGGMTSGAQFNPDGTQGNQSMTPPSSFSGPSFQG
jgi:hypothetical protein